MHFSPQCKQNLCLFARNLPRSILKIPSCAHKERVFHAAREGSSLYSCRRCFQPQLASYATAVTENNVQEGHSWISPDRVTDHGQWVARRSSQPFRKPRWWHKRGANAPQRRTVRRDRGHEGLATGPAAMDAALLLRDARRYSGCPALIVAWGFKLSGPEIGGVFLSVSLHHAFTDPLCAGEDLLTEKVFPRSACGVSFCFLSVCLHRTADPHREHKHFDRAGEGGIRDTAGGALHPGSLLRPGVSQRAVKAAVSPLLHRRPPEKSLASGQRS